MSIFLHMMEHSHQATHFFYHKATGLKSIISIHDTTLGPALGGCRFVNYASEEQALKDVSRLSRGMTYKSAVAGVPFGGGKAVIIGDHIHLRSREFFREFGRCVHSLGGAYITSVDMNTTVRDLKWVKETTPHVTWVEGGNAADAGNPSPMTAYGVYCGLKSAVAHQLKVDSFQGLRVAVQGVGAVGLALCELLHGDGAELVIADMHPDKAQRIAAQFGAQVVDVQSVMYQDVDILAPCALGGVLNDATIPRLKAKIIGGAANNQLLEDRHGTMLNDRGILYCPDYVINAGGLIKVYYMVAALQTKTTFDMGQAKQHTQGIERTLAALFKMCASDKIPPHEAASMMARQKLNEAKQAQAAGQA